MRLRDWPPRRIGRMWLIGIAGQVAALIVVPLLLGWELAGFGGGPGMERAPIASADTTAADTSSTSTVDSPLPPPTITRTEIAPGDTLVRIGRGSSYLTFRTGGGRVEASPDVAAGIRSVGEALSAGLDGIAVLVLTLLSILLVPPLVLGAVTVTWAIQRRRHARGMASI